MWPSSRWRSAGASRRLRPPSTTTGSTWPSSARNRGPVGGRGRGARLRRVRAGARRVSRAERPRGARRGVDRGRRQVAHGRGGRVPYFGGSRGYADVRGAGGGEACSPQDCASLIGVREAAGTATEAPGARPGRNCLAIGSGRRRGLGHLGWPLRMVASCRSPGDPVVLGCLALRPG